MLPRLPLFGGYLRTVYLFFIAAGLLGWLLFRRYAPLDRPTADRRYFWALLWGLLAARVGDYLIFAPLYLGLTDIAREWTYVGVAFWPGLAVGLAVLWRRSRRAGEPAWETTAAALRLLPAALAVCWLGALVDGSAFGTPSALPWALGHGLYSPRAFIAAHGPAPYVFNPRAVLDFTIHPVQAYFILACLGLFFAAGPLKRRLNPRRFSALVIGLLALAWLLLGFLRNDDPVLLVGLRAPQLQALGALVWAAVVWLTDPGGGSQTEATA